MIYKNLFVNQFNSSFLFGKCIDYFVVKSISITRSTFIFFKRSLLIAFLFGNILCDKHLFTRFSEEDDPLQEANVAGMIKIRRSNLVTSTRAWFNLSSPFISETSWMPDDYFAKYAA